MTRPPDRRHGRRVRGLVLAAAAVTAVAATLVAAAPRTVCELDPSTDMLLAHVGEAVRFHWLRTREPPASLDALVAIGRLRAAMTSDPWGSALAYDVDARGYRLCTAGPDREHGTDDDVCRREESPLARRAR